MDLTDDRNLYLLLREGDEHAFQALFKKFYPALCHFAHQFLSDREQSEEIVQEMFVKLWEKRAVLNIETSVKHYLFRSVRNHCLNQILNLLGQSDFTPIASQGYSKYANYDFNNRLVKVYEYSIQNYNKKISLDEVASVAGMNPAAFCRYFKSKMRKTYAEFINELRINNACNLLRNSNETIAYVCYEAGFNNLSNFNRQFKEIIGKSPSDYRKFSSSQNL